MKPNCGSARIDCRFNCRHGFAVPVESRLCTLRATKPIAPTAGNFVTEMASPITTNGTAAAPIRRGAR